MNWILDRQRQHSLYPGQREALTRWHPTSRRADAGELLRDIAEAMNVSQQTVASYLGGAKVALGAEDFAQARETAVQAGLVPFYRGGAR